MTQDRAATRRARVVGTGIRVGCSLVTSCVVAFVIWHLLASDHPELPNDIVGYPAFAGFDYHPQMLAHRLVVWVVPLLTTFLYWLSGRIGPLRDRAEVGPRPRPASTPEPVESAGGWLRLFRLVPVAVVVAVAAQSAGTAPAQVLGRTALVAALGYVALVALAGWALTRSGLDRARAFSTANAAAAAAAAVGSLGFFARHTGTVDTAGVYRGWPWFPLWFWIGAAVVAVALVVWRLALGADAEVVEHRVVTVLVGSVLVVLLVADVAGGVTTINGFDDMHTSVGADLFTRGYFPWRDVIFIHGVFEDGLRTSLGYGLFGQTIWASNVVATLVWEPLLWVGLYLLVVWAAPRRWVILVAFIAAVPWASNWLPITLRWFAVGFVFVLLGEVIRRGTRVSTSALTVALFAGAILVPEMSFQVIAVAVVLVLCDLTERDADVPRWAALRRTRVFVVTGAVLAVAWAIFLLAMGALGDWLDYYLIFGPGHSATGTFPLNINPFGLFDHVFFATEIVVVATLAVSLGRLVTRRPFTPRQWVLFSSAILVGTYAEKALDRFDSPHIGQVLTAAAPLWILVIVEVVDWADSTVAGILRNWRRLALPLRYPTAVALVLVMTFVAPSELVQPSSLAQLNSAPGNNRTVVPDQGYQPPLVGYSSPDAINLTMVQDLSKLSETLAPGGLVYDFTNSPGYFTYLMQQPLTSPFYTVGLALTGASQEMLLDDLEKAMPEIVVFDSSYYGLAAWDGPRNEVRDYEISPYLLRGWTPVVLAYGYLFLVRNDLLAGLPALPKLAVPVQTDDLYSSSPACDWGHVPDYLRSEATGDDVDLDVRSFRPALNLSVTGWTYDFDADRPARRALLAVGGTLVAQSQTRNDRADVATAFDNRGASRSGFTMTALTFEKGTPGVYSVLDDGRAHPVGQPPDPLPKKLHLPNGRSIQVDPDPQGAVDSLVALNQQIASVEVPRGVDLRDFGLATFTSDGGPVGDTSVRLTDGDAGTSPSTVSRDIDFSAVASTGSSVPIRVGACLQWYGFGRHLELTQDGGSPITGISLSDVASR